MSRCLSTTSPRAALTKPAPKTSPKACPTLSALWPFFAAPLRRPETGRRRRLLARGRHRASNCILPLRRRVRRPERREIQGRGRLYPPCDNRAPRSWRFRPSFKSAKRTELNAGGGLRAFGQGSAARRRRGDARRLPRRRPWLRQSRVRRRRADFGMMLRYDRNAAERSTYELRNFLAARLAR